jgi:Domain of unknown function (DUF4331)
MSSHREAPEISKDPVADNADVYAFISPDAPNAVTIVSNFVPLQGPAGGPNFYEFGDDVLYSIYIDNDGDAQPEIEYQFQFSSALRNPNTFLYNTGRVTSLDDVDWNARQFYTVTRIDAGPRGHGDADAGVSGGPAFPPGPTFSTMLGTSSGTTLPCPPCNVGPRSMPDYEANLGSMAVQTLLTGEKVFCGQRSDPFFVDLGSIFDLGALRPFNTAHLIPLPVANGVDGTKALNIHTIAIQVPITMLTRDGKTPASVTSSTAVLGIWSAASRRKVRVFDGDTASESGPWVQVSRLGNPLFNEVIVPLAQKDDWNRANPENDSEYLPNVQHPELAALLPILYQNGPGPVFPHLAALTAVRADLVAILLTGLPAGVLPFAPTFQNFTGPTYADMIRLNVAVPPVSATSASPYGILGGDLAGFPNGRRLADDIVAIELRAIAGATYPLVDPTHTFVPDGAAGALTQGIPVPPTGTGDRYLSTFPYVGSPYDGYDTPAA